jgi:hypothetical protein
MSMRVREVYPTLVPFPKEWRAMMPDARRELISRMQSMEMVLVSRDNESGWTIPYETTE